ncbi:inorganic phosphate transporter, partial [SAR202 cluster bacterium AD-493-K16_JPT_193m]|nr:inorganic phosphate transporter [SAR202 cluster bacterium AD-493-K16_JPT_193m]
NVAAAAVIEAASNIGLPVSTTHTSSSAIVGVGTTNGLRKVSFSVIKGILAAWVVTYPFCFVLGWILSKILGSIV